MEHKVEVVYCGNGNTYYIIDACVKKDIYSDAVDLKVYKSRCDKDTTIKDNLTRKEAENFLLSILKLKGL